MPENRYDIISSPFANLRGLLKTLQPGMEPIDLTIGEPRHSMPPCVEDVLVQNIGGFAKYPPIRGQEEFRTTLEKWHKRRYPSFGRLFRSGECYPASQWFKGRPVFSCFYGDDAKVT